MAAVLPLAAVAIAEPTSKLAGTSGCQAVYGGAFTGRACPTWPQLILRADGSYTWGSERGTWEVTENLLHLSGRKGTGRLNEEGKLIFEYDSQGIKYRQTMFRR